MKYCLKGLLGNKQRNAIFQYIDVCCKILAEKQSLSDVPQLLEEMNSALAVLERDMPITLQVRVLVNMHNMCTFTKQDCNSSVYRLLLFT